MYILLLYAILDTATVIEDCKEIDDCFQAETSIELDQYQQRMCIKFVPSMKQACNKLPKGVKITVNLGILNGIYDPVGYFTDFQYGVTNYYCIQCADQLCLTPNQEFYKTTKALVIVESYSLRTSQIIGQIVRSQFNMSNCVGSLEKKSQIQIESHSISYHLLLSKNCAELIKLLNGATDYNFVQNASAIFGFTTGTNISYTFVSNESNQTLEITNYNADILQYTFNFTDINSDFIKWTMLNSFIHANITIFITSSQELIIFDTTASVRSTQYPNGFKQLTLKVFSDRFVMYGLVNPVAETYQKELDELKVDSSQATLNLEFGANLYKAKSNDMFKYEDNSQVRFYCQDQGTELRINQCREGYTQLVKNRLQNSSARVTIYHKTGDKCHDRVSISITNIVDSCFATANVYFNSRQTQIKITANTESIKCSLLQPSDLNCQLLIQNDSDTRVLKSNKITASQSNLTEITFDSLNDEELTALKSSKFVLFKVIDVEQNYEVENMEIGRIINDGIDEFILNQILIIIYCILGVIVFQISYYLIEILIKKNHKKKADKQLQLNKLKMLQQIDDI